MAAPVPFDAPQGHHDQGLCSRRAPCAWCLQVFDAAVLWLQNEGVQFRVKALKRLWQDDDWDDFISRLSPAAL